MKHVGFLCGKEEPFVTDMINNINKVGAGSVAARMCRVPELSLGMDIPYSLIIDRISHVMPYYLHQLDRARGTHHFEVPVSKGKRLIGGLRKRMAGYAVPRYVREIPGSLCKEVLS